MNTEIMDKTGCEIYLDDIESAKCKTQMASIEIDQLLDELGFNEEDVKERMFSTFNFTVARTLSARRIQNNNDIDRILIGSQREGTGLVPISDIDILQIYKFVKCVNDKTKIHTQSSIVFAVDDKAPPGHTFLWLLQKGNNKRNMSFLEHALVKRDGKQYLSAHKFMSRNDDMFANSKGLLSMCTTFIERKGPAFVKIANKMNILRDMMLCYYIHEFEDLQIDYVRGFPCEVKDQLFEWRHRKRNKDWPPTNLVDAVASMNAVVVPTGQEGTHMSELQWRFCFPAGELALMNSMTNTHIKTYVVLKTIGNQLLRPIDDQITSYVMKNILFWEAEKRFVNDFTQGCMIMCIHAALNYLKSCICEQFLPYYMIPQRNLFPKGFSPEIRTKLILEIDDVLENGPYIIQGCIEMALRKVEQIYNWGNKTKFEQEVIMAKVFVGNELSIKEIENLMVDTFFKQTPDSISKQLYHFLTNNIPKLLAYLRFRLTNRQSGSNYKDLHKQYSLPKLKIETCELPPDYFFIGGTLAKCNDTAFNGFDIERQLPTNTDWKNQAGQVLETNRPSESDSAYLKLQQQPKEKSEVNKTNKITTRLNVHSSMSISLKMQSKPLTETFRNKRKHIEEGRKSTSSQKKGKFHLEKRERSNNQSTSYQPDQSCYWTVVSLLFLEIVLPLTDPQQIYINILIILFSNSNRIKAVFHWIWMVLISLSCVHMKDCLNKCWLMARPHISETLMRERPVRTWRKLKQLCKRTI